jgi:hypothetical protein
VAIRGPGGVAGSRQMCSHSIKCTSAAATTTVAVLLRCCCCSFSTEGLSAWPAACHQQSARDAGMHSAGCFRLLGFQSGTCVLCMFHLVARHLQLCYVNVARTLRVHRTLHVMQCTLSCMPAFICIPPGNLAGQDAITARTADAGAFQTALFCVL